ncbi:RNA polymerase subunit sigma [Paracoccus sp. M683]|nr:sigma factor-like helix-turn-helix DNA-binding protein [Paracoccus sp. M683]TRW97288.1 RNA polymerase subunit sigma [Paracoccus sp. M683]
MDSRRAQVEQLIARIADRDRAALDALYDATSARLHALCLSILKERPAAQDVLRQVFQRVWQDGARQPETGLSPMAWLTTLTRDLALARLHGDGNAPSGSLDALPATASPLAGGPDLSAKQRERLNTCLAGMDEAQSQAIRTIFLQGASYSELGRLTDTPPGALRDWLRRALLTLKSCTGR